MSMWESSVQKKKILLSDSYSLPWKQMWAIDLFEILCSKTKESKIVFVTVVALYNGDFQTLFYASNVRPGLDEPY